MSFQPIKWDDTSPTPVSKKLTPLSSKGKYLAVLGGMSFFQQWNRSGPGFELVVNETGDKFTFWRGTFYPELNFSKTYSPSTPNNVMLIDKDGYAPGGMGGSGLLTMVVPCWWSGRDYRCQIPGGENASFPYKGGTIVSTFGTWQGSTPGDLFPNWVYTNNGNFIAKNAGAYFALIEQDGKVLLQRLEGTIDSLTPNDLDFLSTPNAMWTDDTNKGGDGGNTDPKGGDGGNTGNKGGNGGNTDNKGGNVTPKKDDSKGDESFFSKYKWWIIGGSSSFVILLIMIILIIYYQRKN